MGYLYLFIYTLAKVVQVSGYWVGRHVCLVPGTTYDERKQVATVTVAIARIAAVRRSIDRSIAFDRWRQCAPSSNTRTHAVGPPPNGISIGSAVSAEPAVETQHADTDQGTSRDAQKRPASSGGCRGGRAGSSPPLSPPLGDERTPPRYS